MHWCKCAVYESVHDVITIVIGTHVHLDALHARAARVHSSGSKITAASLSEKAWL